MKSRQAHRRDGLLWAVAALLITLAVGVEVAIFVAVIDPAAGKAIGLVGWLLSVDVAGAGVLGWLLHQTYSPTRRLALASLLLADLVWKLALLRSFQPDYDTWWFTLLQVSTALFLVGTAVVAALFFTGRQKLLRRTHLWKIR